MSDIEEILGKCRDQIDIHYHDEKYSKNRILLQNSIAKTILSPALRYEREESTPWILFTAGPMAAGKSTVLRWLQAEKHLTKRHILVDIDNIRDRLPESEILKFSNPLKYGKLTQKEAGLISELCVHAALILRQNVIVDSSLGKKSWHLDHIRFLRQRYSPLRVVLLHVTAKYEDITKRALERAQTTNRHVPQESLSHSMMLADFNAFSEFRQVVDLMVSVQNNSCPQLQHPWHMTWDSLGSVLNPRAAPSPSRSSLALSTASTVHVVAPHGPAARWKEDTSNSSSLSEFLLFSDDEPAVRSSAQTPTEKPDCSTSSCDSSIDSSIHDYIRCVKRFLRAVDQDIASLEADIAGPAKLAVKAGCQCGDCKDSSSDATNTTEDSATSESAAATEKFSWLGDEDEDEDEIHICDDDEEGGKICSSDEEEDEDGSGGESRDDDDMQLRWVHPEAASEAARHRYSSTSNYCDDEGPVVLPRRNKPVFFNRTTNTTVIARCSDKCRCCLLDSHPRCAATLKSCRGLW